MIKRKTKEGKSGCMLLRGIRKRRKEHWSRCEKTNESAEKWEVECANNI